MCLAGGRQKTHSQPSGSNEAEVGLDAEAKRSLGTEKAPQYGNDYRAVRRWRNCKAQQSDGEDSHARQEQNSPRMADTATSDQD